eukprot:3856693-Rhodomonas_salina.2
MPSPWLAWISLGQRDKEKEKNTQNRVSTTMLDHDRHARGAPTRARTTHHPRRTGSKTRLEEEHKPNQPRTLQGNTRESRQAAALTSLGEVLLHHVERAVDAALVHHAHARCRGELGPVGSALEPLEVLGDEGVDSRAAVHNRVREDRGLVRH